MSEMKALPAWPVRPRPIASDAQTIGYERACYIAALARLRVAVEALEYVKGSYELGQPLRTESDDSAHDAAVALAAIGDIP